MTFFNSIIKVLSTIKKRVFNLSRYSALSDEVLNAAIRPVQPITREDPRVARSIANVRKAFKNQEQAMNARALKPHDGSCKDPLTCKKIKCFEIVPDKIVSTKVVKRPMKRRNPESFKFKKS